MKIELKEAIKEWKKLKIVSCTMDFSCGGDSMNDVNFEFFKENGKKVKSEYLDSFFDDQVYKNVEFYVNSDGYYMGEAGTVEITLNEDDEEPFFNYYKSSESEYYEAISREIIVDLTEKEIKFLKSKVTSVQGSNDDGAEESFFNYQKDCFLSDAEVSMVKTLSRKFYETAESYDGWDDGENISSSLEFQFEVNTSTAENKCIKLSVTRMFYIFKSEI